MTIQSSLHGDLTTLMFDDIIADMVGKEHTSAHLAPHHRLQVEIVPDFKNVMPTQARSRIVIGTDGSPTSSSRHVELVSDKCPAT